jgi:hypothetical protein
MAWTDRIVFLITNEEYTVDLYWLGTLFVVFFFVCIAQDIKELFK